MDAALLISDEQRCNMIESLSDYVQKTKRILMPLFLLHVDGYAKHLPWITIPD